MNALFNKPNRVVAVVTDWSKEVLVHLMTVWANAHFKTFQTISSEAEELLLPTLTYRPALSA